MSDKKIKHEVVLLDGEREIDISGKGYGGEAFLREASAAGRLCCKNLGCEQPRIVYKNGKDKAAHFSHFDDSCGRSGESWPHWATKHYLERVLRRDNNRRGHYTDTMVEIKTDVNKPDVIVKRHPWGPLFEPVCFAVEIACSPVNADKMLERIRTNSDEDIYTLYLFDAESKHFIRRRPSGATTNYMISPAEDFLRDLTGELYYFSADKEKKSINKTKVYGVTYEDIPKRIKLKSMANHRDIRNYLVKFRESDSGLKMVEFE